MGSGHTDIAGNKLADKLSKLTAAPKCSSSMKIPWLDSDLISTLESA